MEHETPPGGDAEDRVIPNTADEANNDEARAEAALLEQRQRRAEMVRGTLEHREFTVDTMECRALDDGTLRMAGYASVTEQFYDVGDPTRGGFRERISRSAFKRTLGESPDVVLLVNHTGLPLARTANGTLALSEDSVGLRWVADMDPSDPESAQIARKVDQGLLDQCSFAFQCTADDWSDDYTERTIKGVSLHRGDVSIVTMGANPATSVAALRSADGSVELRAGKTLSAATSAVLTRVLDLVASADDAVDEAQPLLADLMGVPNPDDDEPDEPEGRAVAPIAPLPRPPLPDFTTRARQELDLLRLKDGRR